MLELKRLTSIAALTKLQAKVQDLISLRHYDRKPNEAKHQIRCNAVLPGMTATEAVEKHLSDDFRALFMRHIPLGRIGLPEEIAKAVVYFASDESAYTTGQILTVSGGFGLATPVYGDLADKLNRR